MNKPQETADCWYTALTLEPEKFSAQDCVNLGNTLVQLGEITKGICCYQYAINLNPNLLGAYQNLGEVLKRQGKLEEASFYYKKVMELDNKSKHFLEVPIPESTIQNGSHFSDEMILTDVDALMVLAEYYYTHKNLSQAINTCKK